MSSKKFSRRKFIKNSAMAGAAIPLTMKASSYANIIGANSRLNIAVVGTNGRGNALIRSSLATKNVRVTHICDVDTRAIAKGQKNVEKAGGKKAKGEKDYRRLLEDKNIDAVAIAAPDHLHAPFALWAMKAGKDVYVEKPCGHNAAEGELLIEAQKKYGRTIQMGNQQRSAPTSIKAIQMIREGEIGEVYNGKAWYHNTRGAIGKGKKAPVPDWLDYELWQGPVPRMPYQDNLIHYNWHWFWHWGTGEICNNGTHEIDICRWALGVDYPTKVSSSGGRYHFDDDWQFYDTQYASFEFEGGKNITWEGLSCNGFKTMNRGRGALIQGTKGSILMERNGIIIYDLKGNVVKEEKEAQRSATTNTVGAGALDTYHMQNFAAAIRDGAKQNANIVEGHKSVLLCHLGNISQKLGRSLKTDTRDGSVLGDPQATRMWARDYEEGWDMLA